MLRTTSRPPRPAWRGRGRDFRVCRRRPIRYSCVLAGASGRTSGRGRLEVVDSLEAAARSEWALSGGCAYALSAWQLCARVRSAAPNVANRAKNTNEDHRCPRPLPRHRRWGFVGRLRLDRERQQHGQPEISCGRGLAGRMHHHGHGAVPGRVDCQYPLFGLRWVLLSVWNADTRQ